MAAAMARMTMAVPVIQMGYHTVSTAWLPIGIITIHRKTPFAENQLVAKPRSILFSIPFACPGLPQQNIFSTSPNSY